MAVDWNKLSRHIPVSRQVLVELDNALNAMIVGTTNDPKLPEWQNVAYLETVAKPRARQARDTIKQLLQIESNNHG